MSDGEVVVLFGGDTNALEASATEARAIIKKLRDDLAKDVRASTAAPGNDALKARAIELSKALEEQHLRQNEINASLREHYKIAAEGSGVYEKIVEQMRQIGELAGVAFSAEAIKEWALGQVEAAEQIQNAARRMGTGADQVQRLQALASSAGADWQEIETQFERLQVSLDKVGRSGSPAAAALRALGVSAAQLRGQDPGHQIEVLAEAYSRLADGPAKTAASIALFGKAGADLIPFLDKGKAGIEELNEALARTGFITGNETLASFSRTKEALDELKLAASGLSTAGFSPLNDAFRSLIQLTEEWTNEFRELIGSGEGARDMRDLALAAKQVEVVFAELAGFFNRFSQGIEDLGSNTNLMLKAVGTQLVDALKMDWPKLEQDQAAYNRASQELALENAKAIEAINKQTEKSIADVFGFKPNSMWDAIRGREQRPGNGDPRGFEGAGSGSISPNLSLPQAGTMNLDGGAASKQASEAVEEAWKAAVTAAQDAEKKIAATLDAELAEHKLGAAQWLKQTQDALAAEGAAVKNAADQAISSAALTSEQKKRILDEETHYLAELTPKQVDAQKKAAEEIGKAYDSAFKSINSAFDLQINGLLTGTENWRTAFKNVLKDLTEQLIKFFVNWGLEQVETVVRNIAVGQTEVAAHVTGAATMQAADQASNAGALASILGNVMKSIEAFAGETGAGVSAFMAPIIGPAAPAAGAAAAGAVAGMASFDIGAWDLPADQVAFVHKREMVIPGPEAGAFRSMLSSAADGGGPGGRSVSVGAPTFNITLMDATTVKQTLMDNRAAVAKAMSAAVRSGAHHGLRY